MDHSFDGHGLSRAQLQAKAEAAAHAGQPDGNSSYGRSIPPEAPRPDDSCEWQGDAPDPELDDLAHACEKNQQPSRPGDTCDWRGDEPEGHADDLGPICQPDNQVQGPGPSDKPVKEAEPIRMPIPRPSKVAGVPEILFPPASDEFPRQKHSSQPGVALTRGSRRSEHGKETKTKKAYAAGPKTASTGEHETANKYPTEGRTHSPWVDSLEQLPATVMDKVNMGVKETLEAASSLLTPSIQEQSQHQEPTVTEKPGRSSSLAPASAAPPPPDIYIPVSTQPAAQSSTGDGVNGVNNKHKRELSRSERRGQREAKRRAKREKNKERRERRREEKERRRKERQWKKTAKKGGELPVHLIEGLRTAGSKVPYNPNCEICTKAAASIASSPKRNPKCATCNKAAEYESTDQYLESLMLNAEDIFVDHVQTFTKIRGSLDTREGGTRSSHQSHVDEGLVEHLVLHVMDFATHGRKSSFGRHKCNNKGVQGQSGRHGLDGNRDSPTTTDGEGTVSTSSRASDSSTTSSPRAVDWWIRAVSSKEPPSSPPYYRPKSPPQRPKTTVYEPRTSLYSVPRRPDNGSAAYHFYLPFAVCHNYCCSQNQPSALDNWHAASFPRSPPPFSRGFSFGGETAFLNSGWAETLPSDTRRPSQDRTCRPRSRSGSI